MKYLGFVIEEERLIMDAAKIRDITTFPRPMNRTELRSFLGLATFYRRFIQEFSTLAEPLYPLLRKSKTYSWKQDQEIAFRALKVKLTMAPILGSQIGTKSSNSIRTLALSSS